MNTPALSSRAAAYELAYLEGVRALDQQGAVMEGFRTRAGLLLSAAAIATSFLGGAALPAGPSMLSWAALGTFVLLGVGVILILWPTRAHEQFVRPALLVHTYVEADPLELPLVHRDLAMHMDAGYLVNRRHLERLVTTFRGCSLLLLVEIVFWFVDLIVKG